jgi:hypothetical protein
MRKDKPLMKRKKHTFTTKKREKISTFMEMKEEESLLSAH